MQQNNGAGIKACEQVEHLCDSSPVRLSMMEENHKHLSNVHPRPSVSPEQLRLFFRFAVEKLVRSSRPGVEHQEGNFHALDGHHSGGIFRAQILRMFV